MQNSFLSALPYLGGWLFSIFSGVIADLLIEKEIFSVTAVRKLFTLAGKEDFFCFSFGFTDDANLKQKNASQQQPQKRLQEFKTTVDVKF